MGLRAFRSTRGTCLLLALCASILLLLHFCIRLNVRLQGIFIEHAGVTLDQDKIAEAFNESKPDPSERHIPRIIHQIFHNWHDDKDEMTIPDLWDGARNSCMILHEDWEFKLWTTAPSRTFIQEEYPWFLDTYDGFRYPVQRVDALRYFLMRHYGGIYIDLDNGCRTNLEPLLYFPTWITDGGRGALSNNILASEPNHPFWIFLTESIITYSWVYPLPFLTIMYATGQWFITDIWQLYHANALPEGQPPLTRIMMDGRPGKAPWTFFFETRGGSWNNWDNQLFTWVGKHVLLFVLGLVLAIATLGAIIYLLFRWAKSCIGRQQRYHRVKMEDDRVVL